MQWEKVLGIVIKYEKVHEIAQYYEYQLKDSTKSILLEGM